MSETPNRRGATSSRLANPAPQPLKVAFDPECRRCTRLAGFLREVKREQADYFCKPVPPFGDPGAGLLIVGLAPGKHGANRTGRPFTGDFAGILLYATLHKFGLASAPVSLATDDSLVLRGARLTNAVKCLPPDNKPLPLEIRTCNAYLREEIERSTTARVILALGTIAHAATLRALDRSPAEFRFSHGAVHHIDAGRVLVDSYHCSRYNTQTRRLTQAMFEDVVGRAAALAARPGRRGP
jgi:uracil-DNA glycosylase family 4